jgi:DeoR family transcriptional regulator of aga operon
LAVSTIDRQNHILHLIERRQRVSIDMICAEFDVSTATARRDLDALVERGMVRRVRGGAVALRRPPPEMPAPQRAAEQAEAKQRIGRAAAALVAPGETVFISSGTTALEVAHYLRDIPGLTVITNSLLVLNALADTERLTLVGLGGMLRRGEMSFIGHVAEQTLAEVRADKIFLGVRAIDVEFGLTNDFLPETMTDRAILRIGRERIVVADHTKCGRVGPAFVAALSAINLLITDSATPKSFQEGVAQRGVRVLAV